MQKADVEHVARLARLEFTESESQKFTAELSAILDYVDELESASTENMEAISQISGLKNIACEDIAVESLPNEKVLQNAPDKQDGYIKVKKVFE